eukprot:CAMPEP_0197187054 /NCGR_PEP_ID=MMETSP1423-20130617/15142_1 /TAXON_ID=476441 /ORGANISM="Pseudo-nitzschia heimii, Strain UNC1101" /LENGTH=42 /DNA_ID= /DNA_START= /DNA_END= /DNA_ORIENTATION=
MSSRLVSPSTAALRKLRRKGEEEEVPLQTVQCGGGADADADA